MVAALSGIFSHAPGRCLVGGIAFRRFRRASEVPLSLSLSLPFLLEKATVEQLLFQEDLSLLLLLLRRGVWRALCAVGFGVRLMLCFVMDFRWGSQLEFWLRVRTRPVVSVFMYCAGWASIHFTLCDGEEEYHSYFLEDLRIWRNARTELQFVQICVKTSRLPKASCTHCVKNLTELCALRLRSGRASSLSYSGAASPFASFQ